MKALRVTLTVIISFILVNLIVGLTIVTSVKDVVQNELIGEAAKQIVISEAENQIDAETIDNILNYNGTNEIIDSVINDVINSNQVSEKTLDLITNFFIDNKEDIEKITGEEIDISKISSPETRENLRQSLNDGFSQINNDENSPIKTTITAYGKVTSNESKTTLLIIIIILTALLILISWSPYKWFKPLVIVLTTSGVITVIIYMFSFVLSNILKQSLEMDININSNFVLITGVCETLIGIVPIVICSIINKNRNKQDFNNINIQNELYENTNQID